MALELLAGPIGLTYKGSPCYLLTAGNATYFDGVGVITHISASGYPFVGPVVIGFDGIAYMRGGGFQDRFSEFGHNLADRTLAMMGRVASVQKIYEQADPYILTGRTEPYNKNWTGRLPTILTDRCAAIFNTSLYEKPRDGTAPSAVMTLPVRIRNSGWITPGTRASTMFMAGATFTAPNYGIAWEYDYDAEAITGRTRYFDVDVTDGIFYSRTFGVWITLSRSGGQTQMRVWADEVAPSDLSDPIAIGDDPTKGRAARVRVKLAGDHDEPVEGYPINWSADVGEMLPAQSVTGSDGYAYSHVLLPPDASGSVEITATTEVG